MSDCYVRHETLRLQARKSSWLFTPSGGSYVEVETNPELPTTNGNLSKKTTSRTEPYYTRRRVCPGNFTTHAAIHQVRTPEAS